MAQAFVQGLNNRTPRYTRKQFKKSPFIVTAYKYIDKLLKNKFIKTSWAYILQKLAKLGTRYQRTVRQLAGYCRCSERTINSILKWCRDNNLIITTSHRKILYSSDYSRSRVVNSPNIITWIIPEEELIELSENGGNPPLSSQRNNRTHSGTLYKYNDNNVIFNNKTLTKIAVDNNGCDQFGVYIPKWLRK